MKTKERPMDRFLLMHGIGLKTIIENDPEDVLVLLRSIPQIPGFRALKRRWERERKGLLCQVDRQLARFRNIAPSVPRRRQEYIRIIEIQCYPWHRFYIGQFKISPEGQMCDLGLLAGYRKGGAMFTCDNAGYFSDFTNFALADFIRQSDRFLRKYENPRPR